MTHKYIWCLREGKCAYTTHMDTHIPQQNPDLWTLLNDFFLQKFFPYWNGSTNHTTTNLFPLCLAVALSLNWLHIHMRDTKEEQGTAMLCKHHTTWHTHDQTGSMTSLTRIVTGSPQQKQWNCQLMHVHTITAVVASQALQAWCCCHCALCQQWRASWGSTLILQG